MHYLPASLHTACLRPPHSSQRVVLCCFTSHRLGCREQWTILNTHVRASTLSLVCIKSISSRHRAKVKWTEVVPMNYRLILLCTVKGGKCTVNSITAPVEPSSKTNAWINESKIFAEQQTKGAVREPSNRDVLIDVRKEKNSTSSFVQKDQLLFDAKCSRLPPPL